jgi:hypothetical protein
MPMDIPDIGGKAASVHVLHALLTQSSTRRRELEMTRVANDHGCDDPVPGMAATRADGTVNSYRLCLQELDEQEHRLAAAYPDEMIELTALVQQREKESEDK